MISVIATCAALVESNAVAQNKLNENLEGYYASPSKLCTKFNREKDKFESCEKESTDCLLIKKIDEEDFEIEVYSTQANQHVCALNGIGKVKNGELVYSFGTDADSQEIEFTKKGKSVLLKQKILPGQDSENCGAHARFEGLRFLKKTSDPRNYSCFKG
ncbi:MAG TPA: hypothetical protein VJ508_15580 [Saprospiraceae bacterium]|nr:hypothetical protein [Saprospiraceae bacterium]